MTIMGHMGQGYIVEMLLSDHYINYSNRIVSFSRVSLRMLGIRSKSPHCCYIFSFLLMTNCIPFDSPYQHQNDERESVVQSRALSIIHSVFSLLLFSIPSKLHV